MVKQYPLLLELLGQNSAGSRLTDIVARTGLAAPDDHRLFSIPVGQRFVLFEHESRSQGGLAPDANW